MSLLDKASLIVTPNGFKASKLYSVIPTTGAGDMDVTRATTGTRVNSLGLIESVANNVPRIDYTNGSCPSLLVEPQRTNLSTYSDNFTDASWQKLGTSLTVSANTTISPDGTQNADTLNVSNNDNYLYKAIAGTFVGNVYNFTIYAKGSGTFFMNIRLNYSTITTEAKTLSNQWQRFNVTVTNAIPITTIETYITLNTSSTYNIWGAQLEAGSYATSYIPTVASSVTRNADIISKTGITSLIGQTEGTIFLDVKAQLNSADSQDFSISDGTTNNRAFIRLASSGVIIAIGVFAGSTEFNIGSTAYTTGTRYKIALAYKNNDVVLYINGTSAATTSTTTISGTLSRLGFDVFTNGAQTIVSPVNAGILFKTRLSNAELATLTTI